MTSETERSRDKLSCKYITHQVSVCGVAWIIYFIHGLVMGAPTVMIPQLRKEANSTDAVNEGMATWLSSLYALAGVPWTFTLAITMQLIGRKISVIIVIAAGAVGTSVVYYSTTVAQILIGDIILSALITSSMTVLPVLISEFASPEYRGLYLTIKSASFFWGIWVANAIGTFFYWKNIFLLSAVCIVSTFVVFIWPESPFWLATKGRFDEATKAHRWLKGYSQDAERELDEIINTEKVKTMDTKDTPTSTMERILNYFKSLACSEFYKPFGLCILIMSHYNCSGKLVLSVYSVDIIKKITDNESTAYKAMLILDGATVASMYLGCLVTKFVRRRLYYMSTSTLVIGFLYVTSLYLYLIKLSVIEENEIVSVLLLVGFTISTGVGPMILCTSLYGELVPRRFKGTCVVVVSLYSNTLLFIMLKLSPLMFKLYGLHVGFLCYGVLSSVVLFVILKYLPETKDKTIQEIDDFFRVHSEPDTCRPELEEILPLRTTAGQRDYEQKL